MLNVSEVGCLTDAEIASEIRSIETEDPIVRRRLSRLGEPNHDEHFTVLEERCRLYRRWNLIGDRYRELCDERTRRLFLHVDKTAAEREKSDAEQRRQANRPFGHRN